jgi:hypothetical protein
MSVQRLVQARFRRGGTIRDEHGETVEQLIHGPQGLWCGDGPARTALTTSSASPPVVSRSAVVAAMNASR